MPWLLAGLFFAALLPTLNATYLQDVDELTHARAALEAARDGHWAPLTLNGIPWTEKPPLLPWLAALAAKLSGGLLSSWPYRIWPCLAAALCVTALARLGALAGGPLAGFFAGALFALQGDMLFHARFFTMDTAVLACAVWALLLPGLAGALLFFLAAWIKGWFLFAYLPPLCFALVRNGRSRQALQIAVGAALGLLSWLAFYTWLHGPNFLSEEWQVNLWGRIQGLTNERVEDNLSYYGKWAMRAAAALIPLVLAAPVASIFGPKRHFAVDFGASLAFGWLIILCLIKAQVINYLLPMEAGICLCWAYALSEHLDGRRSWLLAILAFASALWSQRNLNLKTGLAVSAALAVFIIFSSKIQAALARLPRFLTIGFTLLTVLLLLFPATRYLRHPDDPNKPLVEALLAHPARQVGETLWVCGQISQAPYFYSRYNIRLMNEIPRKRPAEAVLLQTAKGWDFYPALK
jgi:4-amino-4-deoxy-L-arabinose transferase-like glycosyltransferase